MSEDNGQNACPACGGLVKELSGGHGECADCGLALSQAGDSTLPKFVSSVRQRLQAGAALDEAITQALHEHGLRLVGETSACGVHAAPAPSPAAGGTEEPCPVCGTPNPEAAPACTSCKIAFGRRPPDQCPQCGADDPEAKCSCGAILTLRRLLELFDPSARLVCRSCKQLYAVERTECADCGGKLLPTTGLAEVNKG